MRRGKKLDKAIRALIAERHPLVDKKLMGTLTDGERDRLAVVEAEIDRLEMIEHAPMFAANKKRLARMDALVTRIRAVGIRIDNALRDAVEGPVVPTHYGIEGIE